MDISQIKIDQANAVREIFKDPAQQRLVVDALLVKRPVGYSRRSNLPYYNETFGAHLKETADVMISTRCDQCFFFKDFPNVKPVTLYLRIWQSIKYLVERMDNENRTYLTWQSQIDISRKPHTGILLAWKEPFRDAVPCPFKPRPVIPKSAVPTWKKDIEDFLADGSKSKFFIDGLALTPEQMKELKDSFALVQGLLVVVRSNEVKLIKMQ